MEEAPIPDTFRIQLSDGMASIGLSHEVYQTSGMTRERTNMRTIRAEKTPMRSLERHSQKDVPIAIIHDDKDMLASASCPRHASATALPTNQQDAPSAPRNQPVVSQ
ncbi:MAG TPA: hypothetical protein DD473_11430 [Planctomycetaceae bacterium]|nr:hypothetical protein [Planctomycetaceae bacterium]